MHVGGRARAGSEEGALDGEHHLYHLHSPPAPSVLPSRSRGTLRIELMRYNTWHEAIYERGERKSEIKRERRFCERARGSVRSVREREGQRDQHAPSQLEKLAVGRRGRCLQRLGGDAVGQERVVRLRVEPAASVLEDGVSPAGARRRARERAHPRSPHATNGAMKRIAPETSFLPPLSVVGLSAVE